MALLCGWDPIRYLALDGAERILADLVLARANDLRVQERTRLAEMTGRQVANDLAQVLRRR